MLTVTVEILSLRLVLFVKRTTNKTEIIVSVLLILILRIDMVVIQFQVQMIKNQNLMIVKPAIIKIDMVVIQYQQSPYAVKL